jgi:hypothetical protein
VQSRDFCFWLQGFFELSDHVDRITHEQARVIKRHLDMVFAHEGASALREGPESPIPEPVVHPQPAPSPEPEPAAEPDGTREAPVVPTPKPMC